MLTVAEKEVDRTIAIVGWGDLDQLVQFVDHLVALVQQIVGRLPIGALRRDDALVEGSDFLGVAVDRRNRILDPTVDLLGHVRKTGVQQIEAGNQGLGGTDHRLPGRRRRRIGSHRLHTCKEALQGRRQTGAGICKQVVDLR
ncbi:hypothetical protein SDC9_182075 [bioreactor metagenome]|uniref:Uncharacterized protein n=1 Tax=bioreactor metagenome TaxID=1076179 RepID=A0A645H6D4_9ZZZZ